jgi:hypothetical protein
LTPELSTLLAVLAGAIAVIAVGAYWWINRTPSAIRHEGGELALFSGLAAGERRDAIPTSGSGTGTGTDAVSRTASATAMRTSGNVHAPTAPAAHRSAPHRARPTPPSSPASHAPRVSHARVQDEAAPPAAIREFTTASKQPTATPAAPSPEAVMNAAGVPGTMIEGHALRFSVPADGTLQFLPGRLEIGAGLDAGREIRFVHVPGPDGQQVTFGRADGELYRHVQLRDQTVSRAHACLRLRDGTWYLENYSQTNPVVLNGEELARGAEPRALADGDRIEMGEVLFTFRSR